MQRAAPFFPRPARRNKKGRPKKDDLKISRLIAALALALEALTAVDRPVSAGLEGNLRGAAATVADHFIHLALAATVAAILATGSAASGVGDATLSMEVVSPYGTQSVVLRSEASDSYDAVAMLTVGESVQVIGVADGFYYVQLDDECVGCLASDELR